MLFFDIAIYLIGSLLCIWILFDKKLLKSLKIKLNMEKEVLEIDYYREKLDDYSPLIYAKLMGKDIFDKDSITAMILYLKEKGCIVEGNFVIDSNSDNLKSHEKFFIENSKFLFYDLYNKTKTKYNRDYDIKGYLNYLVNKDLVELGLIKDVYNNNVDLIPFLYIMISILFLSLIGNLLGNDATIYNNVFVQLVTAINTITTFLWITIFIIHISLKLFVKSSVTLKGHEYIVKLFAQKRFLEEFSVISSKSLKEQSLLGHYIYMAVLYGLRGKLDDEARDFYIDTIKQVSYDDRYKSLESNIIAGIAVIFCYFPWLAIIFLPAKGPTLLRLLFGNVIFTPIIYFKLLEIESPWRKK